MSAASPPDGGPDPLRLAELWASLFQHLAAIASAAVGGVLLLRQLGSLADPFDFWLALGACVAAVFAAMVGHSSTLDGAARGELPLALLQRLRLAVFALLGIALGALLQGLLGGS